MGIFSSMKDDFFGTSFAKSVRSVTSSTAIETLKEFFFFSSKGRNFKNYLKSYEENPLVYIVVNKIASTVAGMPKVVKDINGDEMKNSVLLDFLKRPNENQSQTEFYQEIDENLLLTGNVFLARLRGDEFAIRERVKVLKTSDVEPVHLNGILVRYDYRNEFGRIEKYEVDDILHIKTSNVIHNDENNYLFGLSPLAACWIVIKSTAEKFNAEASIFKNRGIIGILTSKSDVPMLPKERERLQSEFDEESGGSDKFNKIKISTTDLGYIQTGMSPTDLKLIESIVNSLRIIASIYGMPSVLFNDVSNNTYGNSYETAVQTAYTDVYLPLARKIDEKLSIWLSEIFEVVETIETDVTKIDAIKTSTHPVAQKLNALNPVVANVAVNSLTHNEYRDMLGVEDHTGENGNEMIGANTGLSGINLNSE